MLNIIFHHYVIRSEEKELENLKIRYFSFINTEKKNIWCGTHTTFSYLTLQ